mmetsp:Transcript_21842/g.63876  ORF Transcript_21842/g.63876 Transcript_21842/m.63876 type:complete len:307 (+) Transcript_21842:118-1038(+)
MRSVDERHRHTAAQYDRPLPAQRPHSARPRFGGRFSSAPLLAARFSIALRGTGLALSAITPAALSSSRILSAVAKSFDRLAATHASSRGASSARSSSDGAAPPPPPPPPPPSPSSESASASVGLPPPARFAFGSRRGVLRFRSCRSAADESGTLAAKAARSSASNRPSAGHLREPRSVCSTKTTVSYGDARSGSARWCDAPSQKPWSAAATRTALRRKGEAERLACARVSFQPGMMKAKERGASAAAAAASSSSTRAAAASRMACTKGGLHAQEPEASCAGLRRKKEPLLPNAPSTSEKPELNVGR